ncbi:MAG: hypothetical protein IKD78_13595 [Bacteroidales bacterium]|nr:hypothetical protein [Bacteroidales bacterium]
MFNKYNETNALISFSTDIYTILIWSHYAAEHYGYALELELEPRLLTRVNYSLILTLGVHVAGAMSDMRHW